MPFTAALQEPPKSASGFAGCCQRRLHALYKYTWRNGTSEVSRTLSMDTVSLDVLLKTMCSDCTLLI